ncbi:ileal sodium/bile acid cotransporter isoform X2 [Eurytemora carolleeae]|uniref:ileal sodium/bile acid cotransporter isoform X2 n=1 Tax=Eurytemora carolleeae TaxID=1294199 RepID=UPI000C76F41D|nr:ileal sodium/bile acid cotransporter isoform X2 [Eurytemora carolleeae]|eukprot:XP_023339620.1 ileal sodium/bile acid cotransporter-like isoform X2 [Eurytemora affinis]
MIKYAFFILSFNIYSATSDGCDSVEMLFIDNPKFAFVNNETEFKFEAKMNYTVKLRFTNVDGPVEIRLNSSWHPLGVHPNTFNIEGNTVEEISLLAWVPYVYTVDVYCSTVQQSNSLGHEDSTLTQTNSTLLDTIRAIVKKPRQEQVLTKIFGLVTNVLMAFAMLVMGTDLEFDIILAYLRRPIGPVIGIISQFIGMPVIAYVVGYLILSEQPFARLGLLLIGSSPGGSASNFWTVLFKGDKNLSVTMTFCSSVASFGMTTFWIYILGSTIISEAFDLPYLQLFVSLISLVLPIFVGLLITKKKPKWGARIRQYSRPVFLFIVLLSVGVGIYVQRFFFVMVSWSDFVSGILLSASGYLLGALLAFAARLNKSQIIAVAIETAIQNPGIAIVVIQSNLESPSSEIILYSCYCCYTI